MPETHPVAVPDGLRPLVAQNPGVLDALRGARIALQEGSGFDPVDVEKLSLAALIALGAPADAIAVHVERALRLGLTERQVWGILEALLVIVGIPRAVQVAPMLAHALERAA